MVNTYTNTLQLYEGGSGTVGLCMLCQRTAIWACQRCGDFYCSPECQRRDWQRHRYICFSMPGLMPAAAVNIEVQYAGRLAEPVKNDVAPLALPAPEAPGAVAAVAAAATLPQELERKLSNVSIKTAQNSSLDSVKSERGAMASPPSVLPKPNTRVLLTSFRSPNRCYVRSLSASETGAYLASVKKVDAYGKIAPPLSAVPKVHTYAITQSEGVMCRAEVLAARDEENIRVLLCDYGTIVVRQLRDLRMISNDILRLQQYAVSVQLCNVENYANNDRIMNFLQQFVDGEFQIRYAKEDERGGNVELYDLQSKKCLNDEINRFCRDMPNYAEMGARPRMPTAAVGNKREEKDITLLAALKPQSAIKANNKMVEAKTAVKQDALVDIGSDTAESVVGAVGGVMPTHATKTILKSNELALSNSKPVKGKSAVEPVLLAPFEIYMFKLNSSSFKAVVLDTSGLNYGYIGCIAEADLMHLIQVQEYLSKFQDTNEPYRPHLHEYCIARFENEWYRARVVGIPDATRYAVVYLDFTNENTLTCEDIRRYPNDLKGDCRTNLCLIDGLPTTLNAEHIKFLKNEITTESKITIDKVKEFVQQITVIECRSIIEKMRNQGLI